MSSSIHRLIFLLALLVVAGVVWFSSDSIFDATNQQEKEQSITIDEALIPTGWYIHSLNSNAILTRSPEPPDFGSTEIYAYGDYILISAGVFDGTFENLEEWNQTRWVFEDEALVRSWTKTKIAGHDALRVEHKAAGVSGEHLTYFLFEGNRFNTVSLYSQDTSKYINEFEQFVRKYASTLNS